MNALRLCLASFLAAISLQAPAAPKPMLIAYYLATPAPERYVAPEKLPAAQLTHLNYAFANIEHGEIVVGTPAVDTEGHDNFAQLRALKKRAPHLKTLISVGGWEWSGQFSDVALTPESRARFAQSGVAFIRRHGFDGVDIDWEFPVAGGLESNVRRPDDKANYTLLLRALRDALDDAGKADRRHYLLTAAVGNNDSFLANTEVAAVGRTLDWMNIMAYDLNGPWSLLSGHVAPLFNDPAMTQPGTNPKNNIASIVDAYMAAGVPAEKIVLGVPFYGYSWKGCPAANNGQYQTCAGKGRGTWEDGALDYADLAARLIDRDGFKRYWNDAAKVPYLFNATTSEFVTYDDERSLREKARFIKARRLAGAMFWQITGDDKKHALLGTLARDLLRARSH